MNGARGLLPARWRGTGVARRSHPVALNESSAGKHSGTVQCRLDTIDLHDVGILKVNPLARFPSARLPLRASRSFLMIKSEVSPLQPSEKLLGSVGNFGRAKTPLPAYLPSGRQDGTWRPRGHLARPCIYPACAFRVRAAFFAAADLCAGLRFRAAVRACLESASVDAAARLSRLSAFSVACERFRDGLAFAPFSAFLRSCFAFTRVSSGTLPFSGTGNFTPARLAFERPMAIACLVERAPCSPLRIDSISSRTNSPAWVEADFPSCLSRRARSMVSFFGMMVPRLLSLTTRRTRV